MQNDFRVRMGLSQVDTSTLREKFVNRIKAAIFRWLSETEDAVFFDENFIWWVSEQLGKPWADDVRPREYGSGYYSRLTLDKMAEDDFYQTLELVEKCYQYIAEGKARRIFRRYAYSVDQSDTITIDSFDKKMEQIMLLLEADVGVFWKNGKFYLSGAKELDEALLGDQLDWLIDYPDVKKQFSVGLEHYKKSLKDVSAGKDAMTNSYSTVEKLAQIYLNNDKNFDNNSDALVEKLGLPKEYKNVVYYYRQIAHEYSSRHAGSELKHAEVESFIYLTGLLIRLIIRKIKDV